MLIDSGAGSAENIGEDVIQQLPEDLQAFIVAQKIEQQKIIDALSASVCEKRDAAVKFRASSGIEKEWQEDEEHYDGYDESNRAERYVKPAHPGGVLTVESNSTTKTVNVFYNITRQYVDFGAASVSEMGNPTNDRNFELKPTPIPKLTAHKNDTTPVPATNEQGQPVAATVADFAKQELAVAEEKAKNAQTRIDDYLVECQWHGHQRKSVKDGAKIGTGILKGPFPSIRKSAKTKKDADGNTTLEVVQETVPSSTCISAWNLFPSPDCGDDIHKGSYLTELDFTNARGLRDMKLLDGYIAAQIDKVIEGGPKKTATCQARITPGEVRDEEQYEIWYYYGQLTRKEVEAMGIIESLESSEDERDKKALAKVRLMEAVPCVVTMANDIVIRASLNPLDDGDYPYDLFRWEKREGSPWGKGLSRIGRDAQRIVNAALRNMMQNAALSGGVQVGVKKGAIKPLNGGEWKLSNISFWELTDEDARSINDVLSFHQIPSIQPELMAIIQFGQKMMEDVTGIPLIQQGQMTASAPDTVGGMQMLNKNATAPRRMIARSIDDDQVEPHIRRYYKWILMYGDESEKGDFQIEARGSQTLVERDIARQFAIQMVQNALQPAFGINPYKAMTNVLRAEMIDPKTWQYSEEEFKQIQAQQQQQTQPQVEAAKIRAESAEKIAANSAAVEVETTAIRAKATVDAVQERTARNDEFLRIKLDAENGLEREQILIERDRLMIQREIALLNYATSQKMTLDNVKAKLAETAMKLQTEERLAAAANALAAATANNPPHATGTPPAVQVPGKADNGQSASQHNTPNKRKRK